LLHFARPRKPRRVATDIQELLEDIAELARPGLSRKNVSLSIGVDDQVRTFTLDPVQLRQTVVNLVTNAADAIGESGSIELLATPFPEGRGLILAVVDDGQGMDEETKKKVFEPFFTTKVVGQGSGLGLAQVHGIIQQHAGLVGVRSEFGTGSTFTLYLPPLALPEARPTDEPAGEARRGGGETILVVDDDPLVRAVSQDMLEALDYRVLTAANGEEALVVYDDHADEIAAVLTDMAMPEMGGRELLRALRARQADIRAVAMTGYLLSEKSASLRDDGFVAQLQKPPTLSQLAEAMKTATLT